MLLRVLCNKWGAGLRGVPAGERLPQLAGSEWPREGSGAHRGLRLGPSTAFRQVLASRRGSDCQRTARPGGGSLRQPWPPPPASGGPGRRFAPLGGAPRGQPGGGSGADGGRRVSRAERADAFRGGQRGGPSQRRGEGEGAPGRRCGVQGRGEGFGPVLEAGAAFPMGNGPPRRPARRSGPRRPRLPCPSGTGLCRRGNLRRFSGRHDAATPRRGSGWPGPLGAPPAGARRPYLDISLYF